MLIVGCGSTLRGDDAVGPRVIAGLRRRHPAGATLVDAGTSGFDIVDVVRGAEHVVFVDAARPMPGGAAATGRCRLLDGAAVEQLVDAAVTDLHDFRWVHALALVRAVHPDDYPRRVEAFLVEGEEFGVGAPMSPAVDAAADALVDEICNRLAG